MSDDVAAIERVERIIEGTKIISEILSREFSSPVERMASIGWAEKAMSALLEKDHRWRVLKPILPLFSNQKEGDAVAW